MKTNIKFQESRLIFFRESPESPPRTEVVDQPKDLQATSVERRTPKPSEITELFGDNAKKAERLIGMSDDEYKNFLSGDGDINSLLPPSQAGKEIQQAIEAIVEDFEKFFDSLEGSDMKNVNFETLLSQIGRSFDQHLIPILQKYKGREEELLHGVNEAELRFEMKYDRKTLQQHPERKVTNPFWKLYDSVDFPSRDTYDRALQAELRLPKKLGDLKEDYRTLSRFAEGEENKKDARGMLSAIERLESSRKKLVSGLMNKSILERLPHGVSFSIDPSDAEVVMKISKEQMDQYVLSNEDARKSSDGTISVSLDGKEYKIVYDANEKAYEVVV